jgi:hypothetical protein
MKRLWPGLSSVMYMEGLNKTTSVRVNRECNWYLRLPVHLISGTAWTNELGPYLSSTSLNRHFGCRLRLKCDGTRPETIFRLSAKRTSPLKSAGASVQSTTGSRVVRISGSNAGYTMFRGSVKGTGNALHSPVSPSLPLPCVTVCRHISTGLCVPVFMWPIY